MKTGRFSKDEVQFMRDNAPHLTYIDIAEHLDRSTESVRNKIEEMGFEINLAEGNKSRIPKLKDRPFWKLLKKQFSPEEREYIEFQWGELYSQFEADVTTTEEMQMIDLLKLDVMMQRMLIKKEEDRIAREELELEIRKLKGSDNPEHMQRYSVAKLELASLVGAINTGNGDYRQLQAEKNKIFKDMKSTRDQRYERVENSAESYGTWMAELIENPDLRRKMAEQLEKIRLASIDEYIRLSAYHKYEDGEIDQPLLNPLNVKDDNL